MPGLPAGAAAVDACVGCAPDVLGPERRMDGDPGMAGGTRGPRAPARARDASWSLVLDSLLRAGGRGRRWRLGRIGSACCIGSSTRCACLAACGDAARAEWSASPRAMSALKRRRVERGNGHLCREKTDDS